MELLAVLVILAIIALIIFPIIGDVITDSKMKAFKSSVDGLEHAVDLDYQKDYYTGVREYSYADGNLILNSVKGEIKNKNIKVEGIIENGTGTLSVDKDGNTSLIIYNDEYCATKSYNDKTITVEEKTEDNCVVATSQTFTEVMTGNSQVAALDPDGNLRYVGPTPNNYVWFNKDANGNPERWRIIGVFDGQAKIIRDEPYNNTPMVWDSNNSNNWETASLQLALNNTTDGYIKTIQTNDSKSYGYIDLEHVWNVGGHDSSCSTTGTRSSFYNAERGTKVYSGRPTTWTGAIGLMYPSDYGYASSGSTETCEGKEMCNWDTGDYKTECAGKSWLYDQNYDQWTITPRSGSAYTAFFMYDTGRVDNDNVDSGCAARPVLFLKSDTKIVGGQGTFDQPYELGA